MALTAKQKTDQRRKREELEGRKRREYSLADEEHEAVKEYIKWMRNNPIIFHR